MTEAQLAAARIFTSHYQIAICDDPPRSISDDENWNDEKVAQGFAGSLHFRMIGTEADLNDHWVELVLAQEPPKFDDWQRVTCVHFQTLTGKVHVMSVIDDEPAISADIQYGDYAAYIAGQNLGVDQLSLGEEYSLTDEQIALRKNLEWYRIFMVPGIPDQVGRLKDE